MLRKAEPDIPETERGLLWFVEGSALQDQKRYDEAIQAYHKALADPYYDSPGQAWYNLGDALEEKGNSDEAIRAYHKALEDVTDEAPGPVWNNLGIVLERKGEYEEAAKAYHKALETPNYETPGTALYNLGSLLAKKGEYDQAITTLRKALEERGSVDEMAIRASLSLAYRRAGHLKEAGETLEEVMRNPDLDGATASRAKSLLSLIEADVKEESLTSDDRARLESRPKVSEAAGTEDRIIAKIESAQQTQYEKYLQLKNSDRNNLISILRGWSSAVTLLEGSKRLWRGGGYFLKWQGKGIVIDPGFDFLRNFHDAGYHGREIDAVLVSHNHSDHNSDLKSIDDLRYELYKRRRRDPHGGVAPYLLIWDEDTKVALKFPVEEPEHQFTPVLFDIGRCEPCDEIKQPHGLAFSVEYFSIRHGKEVRGAVGFKLRLVADSNTSFTLGYTGDTEFFPALSKLLADCDLLIAHISQPDILELRDAAKRKKNHLGYRGLIELVKGCKPKFTLVDEFWAGLSDIRIDLVKGIRERTGNKRILPAGIGLYVTLPEIEVECTECRAKIPFDDIRVSPPADRFGNLAYLCPKCVLD